jgi:hypothetical protein
MRTISYEYPSAYRYCGVDKGEGIGVAADDICRTIPFLIRISSLRQQ